MKQAVVSSTPDSFGRRVVRLCLIGGAFVIGTIVLWQASFLVLLLFAGILLAILLDAVSAPLAHRLPVPRGLLIVASLVLIGAVLALGLVLVGPQLVEQGADLRDSVLATAKTFQSWVMSIDAIEQTVESSDVEPAQLLPSAGTLGGILTVILGTFGGLANLVLIVFVGLYLALSPEIYVDGAIRLIPPRHRSRAREVMDEVAAALRSWLLGTSAVMLALGIVSYAALKLIGVPLALLLAVVSGLAAFVPLIGPMVAGSLMILVALSVSWHLALWAGGFYLVLQTLESYLLTPLVQQRAVALAPVMVISAQILMGMLLGIMGVMVATPLAAVALILVKRLYVEDLLEAEARQAPGTRTRIER